MKILVIGNMGYVGPSVVKELRSSFPSGELVGIDTGFFSHLLTGSDRLPESFLSKQLFMDARNIPDEVFIGVDAVVYLAAVSNDPMGKKFEKATYDINYEACIDVAKKAKVHGVGKFVFASSCSVYGFAEEGARTEDSEVNPLTAYAKSKVMAEEVLVSLSEKVFEVTCLRFATACGMSDRLRLDLVLNDFVAGAITSNRINILSDGSPLRPLIHVRDMARAINWAISRSKQEGGDSLVVNVGSNDWNYQVRELAEAVAQHCVGTSVTINKDALPDRRSYRVNFDLFNSLAPDYQPQFSLEDTIEDIKRGLVSMSFDDPLYHKSSLIRLNVLEEMIARKRISNELHWI